MIIDVDVRFVAAHSGKVGAAPTFKHGFGRDPLRSFVDHGYGRDQGAVVRTAAIRKRQLNTAAAHIAVLREALRPPPPAGTRPGEHKALVHIDSAGRTHELMDWITRPRLSYSVGFALPEHIVNELDLILVSDWQSAYDADGNPPRCLDTRGEGAARPFLLTTGHAGRRPEGAP